MNTCTSGSVIWTCLCSWVFRSVCPFFPEAVSRRYFVKKVLLLISQNSQKNTCARDSFNKVAGLRPATLLKSLWHTCFPLNFAKFLRALFFWQNTSGGCFCFFEKSWNRSEGKKNKKVRKMRVSGFWQKWNPYVCTFLRMCYWSSNLLQKWHIWEKSAYWVIVQNPLDQSECRIL